MKHDRLVHRFVRSIPKELEPGVLYVSMEYATAIHACCCGCGNQVVTPITPKDWQLTFNGESISLSPSIGNWGFPCRSHYFIRKGRVLVVRPWSSSQLGAENNSNRNVAAISILDDNREGTGLLGKLRNWLFGER